MEACHRLSYVYLATLCAFALSLFCALPAYALTRGDLEANFQVATTTYETALDEQKQNEKDIVGVENEIKANERDLEKSKEHLADSAVAMYKHERDRSDVLNLLFESESINEAIKRCENYTRIEKYWTETVEGVKRERAELGEKKEELEKKQEIIGEKVDSAAKAVDAAKAAMADADHSDGAKYHQRQGNGSNCGATAFIVGVNILLHENCFTDNVEVWEGPGFHGDSTQSLDFKGSTWLMANGLSDQIACESVAGDIHFADQLEAELDQGKVVILSAGPGSVWQRADGTESNPGVFPDGHWIVFYYYEDGVFYANDSSVKASKGAGCAYTEEQLQEWLNGRENHFATTLSKRHFGQEVEEVAQGDSSDWDFERM